MKINERNNFIRIFQLPTSYPTGFCFGGGRPVVFQLIDWFNPYPTMHIPAEVGGTGVEEFNGIRPLSDCVNREAEITPEIREKLVGMLRNFIWQKDYSKGKNLLAITNYGDSFLITQTER